MLDRCLLRRLEQTVQVAGDDVCAEIALVDVVAVVMAAAAAVAVAVAVAVRRGGRLGRC